MIIISIHIFPHEIKNFQRIVEILKNSIEVLEDINDLHISASLNMNDVIVDNTKYNKEEVVNMFLNSEKKIQSTTDFKIQTSAGFLGVNEERRSIIRNSHKADIIIFLDSDLHFDKRLLANQINAIKLIREINDFFVITPQIVRLWDSTWDCIVNEKYINESFTFHKNINPKNIISHNHGKVSVVSCNDFKWGGGWFNAISANLLKLVGLPDSFVGYGPDDTFVMECCKHMKLKNIDVQQYILKNMVVVEDRLNVGLPTTFHKNTPNFRSNCNKHFIDEISIFKRKL
jgi:hypothetical protein